PRRSGTQGWSVSRIAEYSMPWGPSPRADARFVAKWKRRPIGSRATSGTPWTSRRASNFSAGCAGSQRSSRAPTASSTRIRSGCPGRCDDFAGTRSDRLQPEARAQCILNAFTTRMRAHRPRDEGDGVATRCARAAIASAGASHAESLGVQGKPEPPGVLVTEHPVDTRALHRYGFAEQRRREQLPAKQRRVQAGGAPGSAVSVDGGHLRGAPGGAVHDRRVACSGRVAGRPFVQVARVAFDGVKIGEVDRARLIVRRQSNDEVKVRREAHFLAEELTDP